MPIYSSFGREYYKSIDWTQPISPAGITATAGWENPQNAFDGNASTYARCNTLTDYIEYDIGAEIFLTGMTAQGCQVNSAAVATDLKIFSVNEAGQETLLGSTTGQANTCPYNLTTTFNGVWVKKVRIRITITYSGAPCRILQINLTANKQRVLSTKDDFDTYKIPKIAKIVDSNEIKYYLLNAKPWTQPQIPDNGTFGGDRFAVAGALPYTCYNGSDYTNGVNENSHFEFYNPEPIKVNKITVTSSNPQYAQRAGYVSYSDDNVTWKKSNDWTNPSNNPYEIPVTEIFAHKYWQVYFTQRGTTGNADVNSVRIDAVTQNVQQSNKNDYDYRKINQIREVYSGKNLVFTLGSKVIFEVGNLPDRSGQATYKLDIKRGVYELMCCSGGGGQYCYIGCNHGSAGSFFKGQVYFDHAQTLTIKVGSGNSTSSPNGEPTEIDGCIFCPGGKSAYPTCGGDSAAPTIYDGMQVLSTEINAGGVCNGGSLFPGNEGGSCYNGVGNISGYVKLTYLRAFPKE